MLRIYDDILQFQRDARSIAAAIEVCDRDLARQFRRAAQSIALNTREGMAARDGNRRKAYGVAVREANECLGVLDTAACWGYVTVEFAIADRLRKITSTLAKLSRVARE